MILTENQRTYIPSGAYLGEDDIVRFDGTYGRN